MIPWELDYTLQFPNSARKSVVEALRPLCTPDTESALAGLNNPTPVEVVVAFLSKSDMPRSGMQGCPRIQPGIYRMDGVAIRLSRSKWTGMSHALDLRIKNSNPKLQEAFFGSLLLVRELVRLLEQFRGYAGYLVLNEVDPIGFWHRTDQRFKVENILGYLGLPRDVEALGGKSDPAG